MAASQHLLLINVDNARQHSYLLVKRLTDNNYAHYKHHLSIRYSLISRCKLTKVAFVLRRALLTPPAVNRRRSIRHG